MFRRKRARLGRLKGQRKGHLHEPVMLSCFLYYRLTILPSEDKVVPMFETISKFHKEFMDKYKDDDDDKQ